MASRGQKSRHGFRKGASSSNPDRIATKSGQRDRSTINRLRMYKHSGPIRNRQGKIVGGDFMSRDMSGNRPAPKVARIAPNRRWFGNTRVIGQAELDRFREAMTEAVHDPYVLFECHPFWLSLLAVALRGRVLACCASLTSMRARCRAATLWCCTVASFPWVCSQSPPRPSA